MGRLKGFGGLWKDTFSEWWEDGASRFAAALSLYALLSLGPLLLLVVSLVGLFVGQSAAQHQIVSNSQGLIGGQGSDVIATVLQNAHRPGNGVPGAIIGFVILIFGLTGTVGQMQTALDTMWEVKPKPGQGIRGMLRSRLASLATLSGLLFIMLVSLIATAAVTALTGTFTNGLTAVLARVINIIVTLIIFTLVFAFIYKVVPQAKIRWREVWLGAAVTAILFTIGREAIGLYLAHSRTSSYFGAAGSVIVLVIFIYYSAQIFFVGAEFTQVYANRYGGGVTPEKYAEPIAEEPEETRGGAGAEAVKPEGSDEPVAPAGGRSRPPGDRERVAPRAEAAQTAGGPRSGAAPQAGGAPQADAAREAGGAQPAPPHEQGHTGEDRPPAGAGARRSSDRARSR